MQKMNVGAFAKQMNVSVRTLQYYDQIDLLKPHGYSEGGRRFYTAKESIQMSQIKALKELGFSLEDIRNRLIFSHNSDDFKQVLKQQKLAISKQLENLENAYLTLSRLEAGLENIENLDFEEYDKLTQMMMINPSGYWLMGEMDDVLKKHILKHFQDRPEKGLEIYQAWDRLSEEIQKLIENEIPASSDSAQKIASEWWGMVMEFTKGDMSMLQHLEKFDEEKSNWDEKTAKRQEQIDVYLESALQFYFEANPEAFDGGIINGSSS